jgi:hypothetical protein
VRWPWRPSSCFGKRPNRLSCWGLYRCFDGLDLLFEVPAQRFELLLPIGQGRRQEVLRQVFHLAEEVDDLGGWSSALTSSQFLEKIVCAVVDVQYALSVRWQIFQWAAGSPWRDRPNAL